MNIIDLTEARNRRSQPDPEFIRKDDYGRPLYLFLLTYDTAEGEFAAEIWAYDVADAETKVAGMRTSLRLEGQCYGQIPA